MDISTTMINCCSHIIDIICNSSRQDLALWHIKSVAPSFQRIVWFTQDTSQKVLHTCNIDFSTGGVYLSLLLCTQCSENYHDLDTAKYG
jgi:hypothetical protein